MAGIKINIKGNDKSKSSKKKASTNTISINNKKLKKNNSDSKKSNTSLFANDNKQNENNNTDNNIIPVTTFTLSNKADNNDEDDDSILNSKGTIDLKYIENIKITENKKELLLYSETDNSIALMKKMGFTNEEILDSFK